MAKITYFRDDFDGTEDSTVRPRRVILEEGTLALDLSDDNYSAMVTLLQPFMDAGEWTERETQDSDENAIIRKWARDNGRQVSAKGRLSEALVREYREYLKSLTDSVPTSDGPATDNSTMDSDNVEPTDTDDGARNLVSAAA